MTRKNWLNTNGKPKLAMGFDRNVHTDFQSLDKGDWNESAEAHRHRSSIIVVGDAASEWFMELPHSTTLTSPSLGM